MESKRRHENKRTEEMIAMFGSTKMNVTLFFLCFVIFATRLNETIKTYLCGKNLCLKSFLVKRQGPQKKV